MGTINLLYKNEYAINDKIHIIIPTVGEILDNEDDYYTIVSILTAMPIDFMVQLDDMGIDFTSINSYILFIIFFSTLQYMDTSLIFKDLDLSKFVLTESEQNGNPILIDRENDICIDRAIHGQIAATLRKIHHLKKDGRKPANEEAKEYLLERARKKMNRRKGKESFSQIEPLIVALVNTEQFKYNYEQTLGLSIYKFNESVYQIVKKIEYEHRMHGVYAGTVDPKGMDKDDLNWLVHK